MRIRNSDSSTSVTRLARPALYLLVSLAFAQPAAAGGPLGVGANVGVGVQGGAAVNVPPVGAGVGGASAVDVRGATQFGPTSTGVGSVGVTGTAQPSARALENANGQFISDREFGLDRAQERMNERGAAHQKATEALKKRATRQANRGASASSETSAEAASGTSANVSRKPSASTSSSTEADSTSTAKR